MLNNTGHQTKESLHSTPPLGIPENHFGKLQWVLSQGPYIIAPELWDQKEGIENDS